MATGQTSGMAGKTHPKDSEGITALAWASRKRKACKFPSGGKIRAQFPRGPGGGTWEQAPGRFRAMYGDTCLATLDCWENALARLWAEHDAAGCVDPLPNGAAVGGDDGELRTKLIDTAAALQSRGDQLHAEAKRLRNFAGAAHV